MRNLVVAALGAALLLSPVSAAAQTPPPPPPYGMSIGFDAAKKAIAAAEAEARKNNWPVAIAIVDTGGHLVAFSRLDNTQIGSVEIALGKARTANSLKRATKALQDAVAQGGANLRLLAVRDILPLEGGVPIVVDGKIIGAIGVSGVTSQQDAEVAMAGANAAK
ncbi:MAG TPA: heme-binding protein [Reyranella sp.]|nr:heme-binding protein [Reyranella sp.]